MPDVAVPSGPLLVVSPHLDDAALSCAALLDRDEPLTVLDVFTLVPEPDRSTEWDRRCGFSSAKEAMAAREAEEEAAFAGSRHEVLAVDLLEGQYDDEPRGLRHERRLADGVLEWVDRHDACTIALPAGAGMTSGAASGFLTRVRAVISGQRLAYADPDHLWVRDTALTLARTRDDVTVVLYEEIPHRWSRPADPMVTLVEGWIGATATQVVVPVDRVAKAQRLAAYTSQLPMIFRRGEGHKLAKRLPPDERYWILRPTNASD